MDFITFENSKSITGNFISFTKIELPDKQTNTRKMHYGVILEITKKDKETKKEIKTNETLILFHSILLNFFKDAAKSNLLNPGTEITVIQGNKVKAENSGNEYFEYELHIDGKPFTGTMLSASDFLAEINK